MIDIKRDSKSDNVVVITKTDDEGFHRQLSVTLSEMNALVRKWISLRFGKKVER